MLRGSEDALPTWQLAANYLAFVQLTAVGLFHGALDLFRRKILIRSRARREGRKIEAIPDKIQVKLEKKNHAR